MLTETSKLASEQNTDDPTPATCAIKTSKVLSQNTSANSSHPKLLRTPNLRDHDSASMRVILRDYFLNTFDSYECLFECLASDEAFYKKPISLRHPLIFYYGHTATFFVNKLLLTRMIEQRVDQKMESMFAVGVDEMSWDDLDDTHYEWPTPQQVKAYRDKVRHLILDLIEHAPLTMPIDWNHPWWAIIMGIEHERIHLETSSVLIRQHDLNFVKPHPRWQADTQSRHPPENMLLKVSAGKVLLNKEKQNAYYGWDNEYGRHEAEIEEFEASKYLVSNQEYLNFVEAQGYQTPEYWLEEGRSWLEFSQASHPTFWIKKKQGWFLRLMTEEVPSVSYTHL